MLFNSLTSNTTNYVNWYWQRVQRWNTNVTHLEDESTVFVNRSKQRGTKTDQEKKGDTRTLRTPCKTYKTLKQVREAEMIDEATVNTRSDNTVVQWEEEWRTIFLGAAVASSSFWLPMSAVPRFSFNIEHRCLESIVRTIRSKADSSEEESYRKVKFGVCDRCYFPWNTFATIDALTSLLRVSNI